MLELVLPKRQAVVSDRQSHVVGSSVRPRSRTDFAARSRASPNRGLSPRPGYAPFSPFLTTISKQRGYSAFIVGTMFTLQPIPGLAIRPIVGAITDRYKCRRAVFVWATVLVFALVGLLSAIPGANADEEMNDADVLRSSLFWWFFATTTLINVISNVHSFLGDTICMDLLGKYKNKNHAPFHCLDVRPLPRRIRTDAAILSIPYRPTAITDVIPRELDGIMIRLMIFNTFYYRMSQLLRRLSQ